MSKYDELFKDLTDLDLILLQHKTAEYPQDDDFRKEVLIELGRRQKTNESQA